jgi:hypothetical protein
MIKASRVFRAAAVQSASVYRDKSEYFDSKATLDKAVALIAEAGRNGAKLIVLPKNRPGRRNQENEIAAFRRSRIWQAPQYPGSFAGKFHTGFHRWELENHRTVYAVQRSTCSPILLSVR